MSRKFYKINSDNTSNNENIISSIINEYPVKNKILLFGEVQSGKTNNIINIINGLFDKGKVEYIFYITGNTVDLKEQNFNRLHSSLGVRNIKIVNADKPFLKADANEGIKTNKVVFTILKQYFHLIEKYITKNFENKKILIIDDESDDYSNSEANVKIIQSLINNGIGLISCTATPFTNLYINEDIYDSYYKLSPWPGYSGRKSFKDNIITIDEGMTIQETNLISLLSWAKKTLELGLDDSQLLFNSDNKTSEHKFDRQSIIELIFEIDYNKEKHKMYFEEVTNESIDIDLVISFLKLVMNSDGIKELNSDSDSILKNQGYEIIFGGILLSRGITYENLLMEVYRNFGNKTTAHTLIQRARWFGYRKNKKEHMKIFLEEKTQQAFEEIEYLYEITLNHELNSTPTYKSKINQAKIDWERIDV